MEDGQEGSKSETSGHQLAVSYLFLDCTFCIRYSPPMCTIWQKETNWKTKWCQKTKPHMHHDATSSISHFQWLAQLSPLGGVGYLDGNHYVVVSPLRTLTGPIHLLPNIESWLTNCCCSPPFLKHFNLETGNENLTLTSNPLDLFLKEVVRCKMIVRWSHVLE